MTTVDIPSKVRGTLACLLALALLRCGATPQAYSRPTVIPADGGTLRLIQEIPAGLDPIESESVYESLPINQLFDTLVATDSSLNVVPSLADSWRISRDGLEYRFHLRDDVRFHDGVPLTADDVVFTFERALRRGGTDSISYSSLEDIEGAERLARGQADDLPGVQRVDARTVLIRLKYSNPLFLEMLASDNLSIVPRHVLDDGGDERFARAPIGTGPFVFDGWNDEFLQLRRNDEYFKGAAHLERVQIHFYREGENDYGEARFRAKELDVLEPTSMSLERLLAAEDVNVHRFQELSLSFLGLNARRPPLDQLWLRQAIAHAIDRDRMVEASPAMRRSAPGILPPGIAGFTPESKRLEYDPERARRILANAGHPGGRGIPPIKLYDPSYSDGPDPVIQQMIDDLAAVGLTLQPVSISWAEMGERLDSGESEAFVLAWIADISDPDAFLSTFGENGSGNFFRFSDAKVRAMLERAGREFEPGARGRLYRDVERYVLEQAPIVPLYHTRGALAMHPTVHNLMPSPYGVGRIELERVWLQHGDG